MVGIAIAVEVADLALRAAETVTVVVARVDDQADAEADGDAEVEAKMAVDAAAAQDWGRQGAGPGPQGEEAGAGIEADLDRGVGGGDVVAQRLEHEVGQAVAVDVDEVLLRAGPGLGGGDAAAERIGGQGEAGIAVEAVGLVALEPQGAAARGGPGLRLAEAVAEVELDNEATAAGPHEVRQPVAVDVDEVEVRGRGAAAGVDADADVVRRLLAEGVEAEHVGGVAQRRGGGAEGDVVAFDRAAAHLAGAADADAPAFERAVGQRRLQAAAADHVGIAVAVEVEEVDVGAAVAVGRADAEGQYRDLTCGVGGAAGLDDALAAAERRAVGQIDGAGAEPGRTHECAGHEGAGGPRIPAVLGLERQHAQEALEHRVGMLRIPRIDRE